MQNFPKTETAFQLITEYCTLQRIQQYEYCFIYKMPENTDIIFWEAFRSLDLMYEEWNEIMNREGNAYLKRSLRDTLREYLKDERIKNFQVSAAMIINRYNKTYPTREIDTRNNLTPYNKDGYYVTGHFIDMVNSFFEKYPEEQKTVTNHIKEDDKKQTEIQKTERLRVGLTAKELLYLFKCLRDASIIKNTNNTDIFKAISATFQLTNSSDTKQLSIKHLQNTWSELDAQTAKTWFEKFAELSNKAKMDNPNNIKGK